MGYCAAFMPPEEAEFEDGDFLRYAKFQLCLITKTLFHDAIWESYSDEDILVEYFAHLFTSSKEDKSEMEAILAGQDLDFLSWADGMIEQNQKEMEDKLGNMGDEEFSPEALGE